MSRTNPTTEQGFSAILLLIILVAFMAVPTYYWYSSSQENYAAENVKGASTVGAVSDKPGFSVSVVSESPTWDLVEYLCTDEEECLSSLTAGRRLGTVSGGETDLHEVVVEYSTEWDDYEYVKYFVRSGWAGESASFKVSDLGDIPESALHEIKDGSVIYDVVLSPVTVVSGAFYTSATFSDN